MRSTANSKPDPNRRLETPRPAPAVRAGVRDFELVRAKTATRAMEDQFHVGLLCGLQLTTAGAEK
jgi:hypothetical protein